MKFAVSFAAIVLAVPLALGFGLSSDHPVVGVIDLLKSLKQKVLEEGEAEEITYAKFSTWCRTSERSLEKAVEAGKESIDVLQTEIDAKKKENTTLSEQIAMLEKEIIQYGVADTAAKTARDEENSLYVAADADLATTISAFDEVLTELENAKSSVSSALLQEKVRGLIGSLTAVAVGQLSDSEARRLASAAGQSQDPAEKDLPDFLAKGDYGDHVQKYEFKSDNVVELLKELKRKFEDQRVEGTKRETAALNAYDLAKNARDAALAAAETAKNEKTTTLGEVLSDLATAEGSLKDAQSDLDVDEKTLESTKTDCTMKQSEWEERSKLRQGEVEAIDAGIAILKKVSGVRTEAPTNPVLPPNPADAESAPPPAAFLQQADPKAKAVNLLRQEAKRLKNDAFLRFAEQVASKVGGPFDDVNDMIQKMIFRLMAEQKDEDDHKNWCDVELSKTETSKVEKDEKIKELDLKLDEAKAAMDVLAKEIEKANTDAAALASFIEEATEIRRVGKKENEEAIKEARDAQDAIAKAIAVLEAHYKESGMIAELLQSERRAGEPVTLSDKPSTWEASYTGVADPKAPEGIITVLEKISSDFSEMEADTKAQEVTDEKNYMEQMQTSETEKARLEKEAEMKTQEKQRLADKVASLEKSKKHTREELGAVEQYLKELQPACVEGDSTYEDRKKARDDEIQALKEAQVILQEAFDEPAPAAPAALVGASRRAVTSTPKPAAAMASKAVSPMPKPATAMAKNAATVVPQPAASAPKRNLRAVKPHH